MMCESVRFPYPMKVKMLSMKLEVKYKYFINRSWYRTTKRSEITSAGITGLFLIKLYLSANKGWVLIKAKIIDGVERTLIIFDDGCSLLKISQWKLPQTINIVPETTSGKTFSLNVSPLLHTRGSKFSVRQTKQNCGYFQKHRVNFFGPFVKYIIAKQYFANFVALRFFTSIAETTALISEENFVLKKQKKKLFLTNSEIGLEPRVAVCFWGLRSRKQL